MDTQQLFSPFNLSRKPTKPRLQKAGLALFACAVMLSYADMTQAETTTEAEDAKEIPDATVKTEPKTQKKATVTTVAQAQAKTKKNDTVQLEEIVVTEDARAKNLIGMTGSASQGEVNQAQFEYRPLSRSGELLEVVPGVLATQHSGSGKANQYFLRGFNLDHGTDFTTWVDGIPMNMSTHAHGQGYMDINSVIPELVKNIEYGKGPYYADVGDFSAAGYSKMFSMDKLPEGIMKFTAGEYDYYRTLIANSNKVGNGDLLYAGEFNFYNGVWQQPEDSKKFNGMMRYKTRRYLYRPGGGDSIG